MPDHIRRTFQFCPSCGARSPILGADPFHCEACEFSFYFSPTAAVGGIVCNDQGELLFLIRGKDPGKGKYGLPGGFVDGNETLEDALVREVQEETSLIVTQAKYLCSFPNTYQYRGAEADVLDTFFVCRVASMDSLRAQPDEVENFLIVRPSAKTLGNMAFESNRRAIELFIENSRNGKMEL